MDEQQAVVRGEVRNPQVTAAGWGSAGGPPTQRPSPDPSVINDAGSLQY